ncbi:MAG: hypothetical protein ISS36_01630 [Candidatus Aenigmarchaeota archaeon]|nr:hypothetical protein [Candidatus Aenigmarchaeota archaeon]
MTYALRYPEFTGRTYGVALTNKQRKNKPLIPAERLFVARALLTRPNRLDGMFSGWFEDRREHPENGLFETDFSEAEAPQVRDELLDAIRTRKGALNLWNVGNGEAMNAGQSSGPHAGGKVLSSDVHKKSDSRGLGSYRHVAITGPYEKSGPLLGNLDCSCGDADYTEMKEVNERLQIYCADIATLALFARHNPAAVRNLQATKQRMKTDVFLPFHPIDPQEDVAQLYWDQYGEELPDTAHLMMDVLYSYFKGKRTYFEIGKELLKNPWLYDMRLVNAIREGKAAFEVVANKYIFEHSNPAVPVDLKGWFRNLDRQFESTRWFRKKGFVIEKKDSPFEVVGMEYKKKGESLRLIMRADKRGQGGYPPVCIHRKYRESGPVDPFRDMDDVSYLHPFEELFLDQVEFDDSTRRNTEYRVFIPTTIPIPNSMIHDYHEALERYYPGDAEGFERRIDRIDAPNKQILKRIARYGR